MAVLSNSYIIGNSIQKLISKVGVAVSVTLIEHRLDLCIIDLHSLLQYIFEECVFLAYFETLVLSNYNVFERGIKSKLFHSLAVHIDCSDLIYLVELVKVVNFNS